MSNRKDKYKKPENLEKVSHKNKPPRERKEEDITRGISLNKIKPSETAKSLKSNGPAAKVLSMPLLGPRKYFDTDKNMTRSYENATPEFIEMKAKNLLATAKIPRFKSRQAEYEKMANDMFELAKKKRELTEMIDEGVFGNKYRSGPAELTKGDLEQLNNDYGRAHHTVHHQKAKDHDEGARVWFHANGERSVAGHKQKLRAQWHRDEEKKKKALERDNSFLKEQKIKTPNVNRLYEAYAEVYKENTLNESKVVDSFDVGEHHGHIIKHGPNDFEVYYKRDSVKEPNIKKARSKDEATGIMDMFTRNLIK